MDDQQNCNNLLKQRWKYAILNYNSVHETFIINYFVLYITIVVENVVI